jgi:hypothetical protein
MPRRIKMTNIAKTLVGLYLHMIDMYYIYHDFYELTYLDKQIQRMSLFK